MIPHSPLCDKQIKGYEDPEGKFRKNPENSPVFEEFFLGLASFRQSVLPCRQYVEGIPELSTFLSDLPPNLTKSSAA
jgi:hypothetical protein